MPSYRQDRVAHQIRRELMDMLARELKDPRLGFISITRVEVTPDLQRARVRVSVLGDEAKVRASLEGLRSSLPYMRRELGRRLENLRRPPQLIFELDQSIAYSVRISALLREVLPAEDSDR